MTVSEIYHYDSTKELIHLPGKITGPLDTQNIRFVFDPGAYRTIISTKLADYLGYQTVGTSKRVATSSVAGKEYGYTIVAKKMSFLSFEFTNTEVACFDLPPQYEIDGLLGLDLIKYFEVTLRHRERWIQFRRLD